MVVAGEVALSLILICGALLLFRSLPNLQRVDLGVRVDGVVTLSTDLPGAAYPTSDAAVAFYRTLTERVEALPGVERASLADDAPLEGGGGEHLRLPGRSERLLVRYKRVAPGYFSTLEIPVTAGREFAQSDRPGGREVLSDALTNAGVMVAAGLAAGLAGAVALTRILSSLLFEVSPLDPTVLFSAAALMAVIGLGAAALPAVRASRVNPTTVLRSEG